MCFLSKVCFEAFSLNNKIVLSDFVFSSSSSFSLAALKTQGRSVSDYLKKRIQTSMA